MEENIVLHTTDGVELALPIAGIGGRSYAFLIDWHIRVLLAMAWLIAAMVTAGLLFGDSGKLMGEGSLATGFYFVILPSITIYVLYHPFLEIAMKGRTPGKRMAGIRIVSDQGQTPGVGALLIRNIFRLVDSLPVFYILGLSVAMATGRQVRIGDLAAGTLLVYEERPMKAGFNQHLHEHPRLGPTDLDWLEDLLDRWEGLDREVRRGLAVKFLERVGEPQEAGIMELDDRALHERLTRTMQESRGKVSV